MFCLLCNWLISFNTVSSGFGCITAFVRIFFFFRTDWYSVVYVCSTLLTHSSILGIWLLLSLGYCVLWTRVYEYFFSSLRSTFYIPRSEIAGSYGSSFLWFWGTIILFPTAAAPFYTPISTLVSLCPCWHFFIIAIQMDIRWYLLCIS